MVREHVELRLRGALGAVQPLVALQTQHAPPRAFDVTGAGLALIVLAPLFAVVAAAIKLDTLGR